MNLQVAKTVFLASLSIMKKILDLVAFKVGKDSADYKYYKKEIMNYFYDELKKLFKKLFEDKILVKCECNHNLRQGYTSCKCGGSGYKNYEKI